MIYMLDIRRIRANPEEIKNALAKKGEFPAVDELLSLDQLRRDIIVKSEQLKRVRNEVSDNIAAAKKAGQDAQDMIEKMREASIAIKEMDQTLREYEERIEALLLEIPNIPHESVPIGKDEKDNTEISTYGVLPQFDFEPKAHWDLGTDLGLLDFERAAKITGARFVVYRGLGARLERALINFMLDLHTEEHGYKEIYPPVLVNSASMTGTGQLPKFGEDMFKCEGLDYYLVPTAEVPVTNLLRNEILDEDELPVYYVAYTACFRAEAGAAGRDTRGLIRQHQFDKVELVKFVNPKDSYDELDNQRLNAGISRGI
jgi:seryl-tRNA synthetase